uniref:Uncharacterized protein n=1 Tax=Anguilla anguilla TaxID=7936 RepID=A0A0E9T8S5_ANGAN
MFSTDCSFSVQVTRSSKCRVQRTCCCLFGINHISRSIHRAPPKSL